MKEQSQTLELLRVFRAPPLKLYKAFTVEDALARWLPPNGFTAKVLEMDVREGGRHRMSFTNFSTGESHSFGGTYLELVPGTRLKYTDIFDDPGLPGTMLVTVEFRAVACGSEMSVIQENIPAQIPLEFCRLGWQESLDALARLVEPEIQ